MGLPRLYGDETSEEAAMLPNSSLGTSPQFSRISSPIHDGSPESQSDPLENVKIIGYVSANSRGMSSAVTGDLEKKNVFEFPKGLHTHTPSRLDLDISSNINARRNGVDEKRSNLKLTQGITNPASRVVGFKSPSDLSPSNVQTVMSEGFQNHSPFYTYEDNSNLPSQLIGKRTLSPLSSMFPSGHGGILGGYVENERKDLLVFSGSYANEIKREQCNADRLDFKKANCADCSPSMPLPIPRSHKWEHHPSANRNFSIITTDGPLLDGVKILTPNFNFLDDFHLQSHNGLKKKIAGRAVGSKCSKSPSLLSLSPLGPRWHNRMRLKFHAKPENGEAADANSPPSRNLNIILEEYQTDNTSVLEDEIIIARKSFQEFGIFCKDLSPSSPHEYAGDGTQCSWESTSAPQTGIKIHRSFSGLPTRSLVGSFEESLLSGRFSSGKASQRIDGFLAVLNVSGGSFSPPSRKLPFSVTSVDGNSSLLYYASVDLAGNLPQSKSRGSRSKRNGNFEDSRAARSRYRIPVKGRIQLVLSNPEMTPVHTFMCNYDLSDMPPGTKTFMRHKVSLASSGLTSTSQREISPRSRDMAANSMAASSAIVHGRSLQSSERLIDAQSEEKICSMRSRNLNRLLKDKASEDRNCTYSESSVNNDIYKGAVESVKVNSTALAPNNILDRNATMNFTLNDKKVSDSLELYEDQGFHKEDDSMMDICYKSGKKAVPNSAKVNDNMSSGGVLRYALHLFFLCPPLKKGSNSPLKCNSDSLLPSSVSDNSMQVEDERHFYLYNDLRVVFPQRHSDTDEGKLQVECHFPANPKYFEYSN